MTAKKTSAKKAASPAKSKPGRKPKTASVAAVETPAGECPRGGNHEWVDDDDGHHCGRCFEPGQPPAKAKRGRPAASATAAAAANASATAPPKPEATGRRLSAIDAAAKVLAEAGEPLNVKRMIEAMAAKGYWTSPGGKTPHATLYSAILREITVKGTGARFKKTDRGHFAVNG